MTDKLEEQISLSGGWSNENFPDRVAGLLLQWLPDESWTLVFAGSALQVTIGHAPSVLLHSSAVSFAGLVPAEDRIRTEEEIRKASVTGATSIHLNFRIANVNGQLKHLHGPATLVYAEDNRVRLIEAYLTEHFPPPDTAAMLRQREKEIEELGRYLPGAFFRLEEKAGEAAKFTYVSDGVQELMDNSPEEWYRQPELRFSHVHPYDLPRLKKTAAKAHKAGLPFLFEFRRINLDGGDMKWVRVMSIPLPLPDGRLEHLGILQDITQTKQAEAEVERHLALLQSILDATGDAILVVDTEGKVLLWNSSYASFWNMPVDVLRDRSHHKAVDHMAGQVRDPESFRQRVYRLYTTPEEKSYDLVSLTDGRVVERHSIPLYQDGKLAGRTWSFRDMTRQKRYEVQLEEQNQKLAKVNYQLGRFIYSASHEMRAPVLSLMGLVSLAVTDERDEDTRELMEMLQSSVRKLDRYVRALIQFSNNSNFTVELKPVHLEGAIYMAVKDLYDSYPEAKLNLRISGETDIRPVIDEERLRTILSNIFSNAYKFRKPGQAEAELRVQVSCQPNRFVLEITDEGMGIKPEHQARIFDLFYRDETAPEGAGLGLFLVKEIVETLNGTIEFSSAPGEGSCFRVSLPDHLREPLPYTLKKAD